jgi:hypothetical protein
MSVGFQQEPAEVGKTDLFVEIDIKTDPSAKAVNLLFTSARHLPEFPACHFPLSST